jgi:hypothetical protein
MMRRPMKQRIHPTGVGGEYAIVPGDDDGDAARLSGALREGEEEEGGDEGRDGLASHKLDLPNNGELRLNVFRESPLFAGQPPRSPRYDEARPKYFPPQLNVFLTGGLYTSIHNAMGEFAPRYSQVHALLVVSLAIWYVVAFWGTPIVFQATGNGGRRFSGAGFAAFAAGVRVVGAAAFYITRPIVGRFHYRMEAVVREMSPLFRRAGYDLEYHRREPVLESASSWWARLYGICDRESFVRIVPFRGELTREEAARAAALFDPQRRSAGDPVAAAAATATAGPAQPVVGEFRVAVYGAQAHPGQVGFGREPNFVMARSFLQVCDRIDEHSWGAVATEMRTYTERYHQVRSWRVNATNALWFVPAWMPDAFSPWYMVLFGFLYVFLFYPTSLEVPRLTRVGEIPQPDEIQAAIQRLSPLVEERSGYGLRLDTEPEGWLGGTGAYVCFVPCDIAVPSSSV